MLVWNLQLDSCLDEITWRPGQQSVLYQWTDRTRWHFLDWCRSECVKHARLHQHQHTDSSLKVFQCSFRSLSSRKKRCCSWFGFPSPSRSCSFAPNQQHFHVKTGLCIGHWEYTWRVQIIWSVVKFEQSVWTYLINIQAIRLCRDVRV